VRVCVCVCVCEPWGFLGFSLKGRLSCTGVGRWRCGFPHTCRIWLGPLIRCGYFLLTGLLSDLRDRVCECTMGPETRARVGVRVDGGRDEKVAFEGDEGVFLCGISYL